MRQNLLQKVFIFTFVIIATWSCEKDDICATSTPTTPHLIILFNDINAPDAAKNARRLSVRGFDANNVEISEQIIANMDTDSIALPLRFEGETPTTSRFILEKDTDFFLDDDPLTNSNIDIITVNYTPEFVYVSQACGYKSIFTNLSITVEPDADNWIFNSEVLNITVENETQAHIILRH